jgi:hypothetical protein
MTPAHRKGVHGACKFAYGKDDTVLISSRATVLRAARRRDPRKPRGTSHMVKSVFDGYRQDFDDAVTQHPAHMANPLFFKRF